MNVLYVSKALVAAAYRDKIRELGREVRITAIIPDRWGRDVIERSDVGVPEPIRVPVRFPGRNHFHVYPGAREWLAVTQPDLVHIDEEPYSLVTLQLGMLCGRLGIPFVFFAWQNLERQLPPPFGRLRTAVFRRAAGAIAGTTGAARVLERAGYSGLLAVIPQFGVDPDRFRPDASAAAATRAGLGIPGDAFLVGFGGRLVAEKGVHVLLDAFARLGSEPSAPHLLFAGDGPESRPLAERSRRLGIGGRVHFKGRVDSTAMAALLPALDVLVLPTIGTRTWTEQFGRILVEAMACGVPVIGSRCGEIPNVIDDAGDLFPVGDADALASILEAHHLHPALRTARSEAGRARVLQNFTQHRVAADTAAFYSRLLERAEVAA